MWFKMFNRFIQTGLLMHRLVAVLCVGMLMWLGLPVQRVLAQDAPLSTVCKAFDFRAMAYSINDAQTREKRALEWLARYGKDCPFPEIEAIRSNVAVWLGTANTEKVHQTVKALYLSKKPSDSQLQVSKNTSTAPVIEPAGSLKSDKKPDAKNAADTVSTAPKKIKKLPNKVEDKIAASKEFALRESEIAQCLPDELVTWNDGDKDSKMLSPKMLYVYDHQGAPSYISEDAVFSVLQQAASAWDQCGGQNAVMLKRDVFDDNGSTKIAVQWSDKDKLGTIGLANITKKILTLSPEAFANLRKANANRNLMETLQMVVSHEVGHFQGLIAHSRRCVDVLSYYSNDAGEKCSIRGKGVMPQNFEYRSLLPTACDIQRCRVANGF
jgi:hypothetical protein